MTLAPFFPLYSIHACPGVYSCAVIGLDGVVVEVEVDYTAGFPGMTIVGLPDAAIQESRERVQAAVRNAGVPFPRKRLVVNLAPASVRKEGPAYDLPIAVGVLLYTGMLPPGAAEGMLVVGELSLDGAVRHRAWRAADGRHGPPGRFQAHRGAGSGRGRSRPDPRPGSHPGRFAGGAVQPPGRAQTHPALYPHRKRRCPALPAHRFRRGQGPGARQARPGSGRFRWA